MLGDTLYLIRYLTLSAAEFAAGPAQSGILLQQESFSILMNISCPGSWELPEYMAGMAEPRKDPGRLMEPPVLELRSKHWCKRAMMQVDYKSYGQPHPHHNAGAALSEHLHSGLFGHVHR